jgi:hypothetical protein
MYLDASQCSIQVKNGGNRANFKVPNGASRAFRRNPFFSNENGYWKNARRFWV